MDCKIFLLILFLVIILQCIESKKVHRSFLVIQDKPSKKKLLSDFTVFDLSGKNQLYRLKTSATDIDSVMLVDHPAKNMIANAEGEWIDNIFNVTMSIYDKKLSKWIDGTIKRLKQSFTKTYRIEWNQKSLIIKCKFYTKTIKIYNERPEDLVAEVRHRARWLNKFKYKYDLKIYSDKLPDAIYLLALTIMHHADPVKISKS